MAREPRNTSRNRTDEVPQGRFIHLCLLIGAALGYLLGSWAVGVSIGFLFGVLLEAGIIPTRRPYEPRHGVPRTGPASAGPSIGGPEDRFMNQPPADQPQSPENGSSRNREPQGVPLGVGISIGVALGITFGLIFDNLALGIVFGTALGILYDARNSS